MRSADGNGVSTWSPGVVAKETYVGRKWSVVLQHVNPTRMTRCKSMTAEANDVKLVQDTVVSVDGRVMKEC